MEKDSRGASDKSSEFLGGGWVDPIEVMIRDRVRGFIEELVEAELDEVLGRSRYGSGERRHGAPNRRLSARATGTAVARFVRPGDD